MTKKIIITGATSGIGKGLTLHLAKQGHSIIAVGRNQAALDELTQSFPDQIIAISADLTKTEDRLKVKQALSPDEQSVYLVRNAGIAAPALLIAPEVVAKYLSWLLFETDMREYVEGDWDIYDESHHQFWAEGGDIKVRQN